MYNIDKDIEKFIETLDNEKFDVEKLALYMLLKQEKFIDLHNSKKESDKIRTKLYTKQYALINYDFLVELHFKQQELKCWTKILEVTKSTLKEREVYNG
jgi:hypothetical protein